MITEYQLTDYERYIRAERGYTNTLMWDQKNWDRIVENWRFYWAIDSDKGLGQWPSSAVPEMIKEGRQLGVYNFCRSTVDNIAGGIMKAPWSYDFSPVNAQMTSLTYALKDVHYIDRELCDWRIHELEMVIGGLIGQSVMEMYINREYDKKQGNIGLRTVPAGSVRFDVSWKSGRSKDCRKAYRELHLTARDMLKLYTKKTSEIVKHVIKDKLGEEALKTHALQDLVWGEEYGPNNGIIPFPNNDEIWGSFYKVVELYEMETITTPYEYVVTESGDEVRLPANLKTPEEKIAWLNDVVPGWIPDQVFSDTEDIDLQYKTVFCPSMGAFVLAYGPTEVQAGRLQFFPWSAARINGEYGGIIDLIKDAQKNINYWESLITYKIQVEGGGGAQFADKSAFASEADYVDYVRNRNNPRKVFPLKQGALREFPNGPAVPVVKSPFPQEAMNHLQHLIAEVLPRISKTTPASQGRSESSQESGYLYRLKKLQADIEQYVIYESLRNFWNEVGEAYLFQAARTYGNGIERKFYNPATKQDLVINKRETRTDDNGNTIEVMVNDFSQLLKIRHKVQVTESEDSPTRKVEIMQVAQSLLQNTPPEKALTRMELAHTLAKQLDSFDEEKKRRLDMYHEKEMELVNAELEMKIAQAQAGKYQAEMAMQPPPPQAAVSSPGQSGTAQTGGGQVPQEQKPALTLEAPPGMGGRAIPSPLSQDVQEGAPEQQQMALA
jgi:hypothetical protein